MAFDCSGLRSCCCSCQLPDQTKRPRYERRAASPDADSPGDQPELHRDLWAEWAAIAGTTARLAVHGVPILPLSLFPVPQCESQFGSLLCMVMAASNSFRTAASIQAAEAAPFLVDYDDPPSTPTIQTWISGRPIARPNTPDATTKGERIKP